jgi:hypothetical protein
MTHEDDRLVIGGTADFDHGDPVDRLTHGEVRVRGDFKGTNGSFEPCAHQSPSRTSSTRRLFWRPSGVSLESTGRLG